MNLKKLFATMAGVSLFAQAVVPVSVRAASYPEVYQEAYNYAYDVRVTTQSPIDNAGLYRDITRAEAAKMISNRAENVLGRKVTNNAPTYTDIASLRTSDLYDAIIKAGELGLMNGANGKFRPHDTLTRGEFATIVSRALWGDKYEGGTPYYAQHLNALNTAGIMTVINNPEVNIIRGDVMIMLMRADKEKDSSSNINCDDLLALFEKGSAEYEAAKKICESQAGETGTGGSSTVVKAGDLDVAVTDYSSTIKSAPAVGTVIFNKVEFRASQSVSLNTITVAIAGLTSRSSIDRVWFEKDGVALTSKVKPTTDGTASLTFKGNFAVKSNETLDLVVALSGAAGAEVSFKIANVDSSAYNVNLRDVLSSTYRTTAYKVATLDITTDSTQKVVASTTAPNSTFKLGSQASYTIGKLNIQNNGADNEDRVVNVKSVLLKNAQSTDLSFLKNIQVLRDGTNVAKNVTIDGRNLQITLNDTIQAGKKAIYTIVAEIGNMTDVPSYIQLQLQAFSDVVADEANTNFRTNNTTSFEYPTPPSTLYFNLYKFDGGKITFASDASFPTVVEAASGANDVVIASGTLTLTEPISFKAFSLTGNTGDIRKLSLEIGGVRYVAESSDNGVVRTFKWDEIYVTKTANVKLLANLENNPVQSVTLNPTIISQTIFAWGNYTNTDTNFDKADIAGRIQIAKINVTTPRFSLNNNLSTTQTAVIGESASRTIFEGHISAKKNITVDGVTFTINDVQSGVNFEGQNIDLDLYVGDSVVDSKTIKIGLNNVATFNTNVKVTETAQTVKIVASLASNGTGRIVGAVVANGTDAEGNKNSSSPINTVAFRVLSEASVSVTNAGSTSQSVIEGANARLTEFTASVTDGTTNLSTVLVSGTNLPANQTATLTIGGNTYQSISASGTLITFSNVNANLQEGDYKATITTNVNTDGKLTGTLMKVDNIVLTYTDAAGSSKSTTGTINATYYFVKAFPVIGVQSTTTKNQITLKITNGNNQAITLSGLNVAGSDVTIDGQVVHSGATYTNTLQWVSLDTPRTLGKQESIEIVLKTDGTSSSPARLAGIEYTVISAGETYTYKLDSTYTNVGRWGDFSVSYSS